MPSAEYPHYLIKLQELGAQVRALALVDDVERFWARRLGQQILAGSERGRTRRIFAFRNAEDLREYATTVWEHSRKYEVRVASMQFLKPNFGDFARDFSIIQVPGDERPVLARYVTDRNEMGIEFTADTSQTAIHELKYATIWDKAIDPVDPDQERQFDMFVRTVFEARRPLEMSRYIKIEDYDRYEERHAHFVEMMERMVAEFLRSRDLDRFCKLLEMGAGTGHLTSRLIDRMDRKARLTALEYDFECYRYLLAKRNLRAAGGVCEILNEDSRTFDPHGKFDFIFSSFADHHIVRSEEQAGIYFENLKRNMHRHSFYIVGDEFLPPHDLNDRADRERALRHYHGYIIDVARKQQALAPEELKKEYDELIFLETRALESGLTNDGDFKVSLVQYLDRLERHGLAYDEPIPIGPLDSELRERVGGIYVIRVYLAPAQARSA
ncbi:MAG TPA: class I SAM-dependent methyltransferase [Polyangiales bacterium]|nr:class I SAM-dependent methyltransferase [Polyangiales bacterium]